MTGRAAILLIPLLVGLGAAPADAQTRIRISEPGTGDVVTSSLGSGDLLFSPRPLESDEGFAFTPAPPQGSSLRDSLFLGSIGGIEAELLRGSNFAAGVSSRSERLHHRLDLGGIDSTLEFGAFGEIFFDDWSIIGRVGQDFSNNGGGFVADLGVKWASQISNRWRVELGSEISWGSGEYMGRAFGVDAREAAGTGLRLYDPSPGLKDVTVSGAVTYSVSENWTVGGLIGAQRLIGAAASSPLITDEEEFFGGISLDYRF